MEMAMKTDNAKILVIGAGVNGSICAAELHRAGVDVTVLARGKRLEELCADGIIIENPIKKTRSVTRVPVVSVLKPDDHYDYVLVVVRKNQVRELLPVLAANRSPVVVFMVNNPSGPDEWVAALGRERVMLGFVFGGGKRDGNVIRAISGGGVSTPFGELDGAITSRLVRLVGILRRAGLKARAAMEMSDWLATHAALVAPFAVLAMKHGCNTYELAKATDDLRLLAGAMRETVQVLRALGRHVIPRSSAVIGSLPRFILVALFRVFLPTKTAEIGGGWHCSQAPDEMHQLAAELKVLMQKSGLAVPALRAVLETV
jgi:2-dehydropantoate 2-reductase